MHLSEVFATADDLLSVPPEDLAGVIMEVRDPRHELFTMTGFIEDCMERPGRSGGFPAAGSLPSERHPRLPQPP